MTLGLHADFIIASYALTAFVVAALIIWVVRDHITQQRVLGELEARGVTRRARRED